MSKLKKIIIFFIIFITLISCTFSMVLFNDLFQLDSINSIIKKSHKFILLFSQVITFIVLGILFFMTLKSKKEIIYTIENKEDIPKLNKKQRKEKVINQKQEISKERQQFRNSILQKLNEKTVNIKDLGAYTNQILSNIANEFDIMQALFFVKAEGSDTFKKYGAYAFYSEEELKEFKEKEGLSGQVAANKKPLNIKNIPDNYITVMSGLGQSAPNNLLILPVIYKGKAIGIVELASFKEFEDTAEDIFMNFFAQVSERINELSQKHIMDNL